LGSDFHLGKSCDRHHQDLHRLDLASHQQLQSLATALLNTQAQPQQVLCETLLIHRVAKFRRDLLRLIEVRLWNRCVTALFCSS
jgi:hypothetical protein